MRLVFEFSTVGHGAMICLTSHSRCKHLEGGQSGTPPLPDRPIGVSTLEVAPNDRTIHNQTRGSKRASVWPGDKALLNKIEDLELSQHS